MGVVLLSLAIQEYVRLVMILYPVVLSLIIRAQVILSTTKTSSQPAKSGWQIEGWRSNEQVLNNSIKDNGFE
jgi:hypothetical protein